MPFPGHPLASNKTNGTPAPNDHPDHHNALAVAANDLQSQATAGVATDVSLQNQINAVVAQANADRMPTGTIIEGVWVAAPAGYLLVDGSTIVNGQTTYPALWSVIPASWKSGSSIVFPNSADRVMMGGGTIGDVGGANTHTLATGNLPSHTHDIDHNHALSTSTGASVNHTHDIDHNHPAFNTASAGTHSHDGHFLNVYNPGAGAAYGAIVNSVSAFSGTADVGAGVGPDGAHLHSIDVPLSSGFVSGGHSVDHTHNVDLPNFVGASGATGSGTAVDHTPAHMRVRWAIKT